MADLWRELESAFSSLGSARNKQEAIARLGHGVKLVRMGEQAVGQTHVHMQTVIHRCVQLICELTGGRVVKFTIDWGEGGEVQARCRILDSSAPAIPLHTLEPGAALLEPKHALPLHALIMEEGKEPYTRPVKLEQSNNGPSKIVLASR